MPLVRTTNHPSLVSARDMRRFGLALSELVPAAMNSKEGPLTPGSICYISGYTDEESATLLTVDSFIEVEAYYYSDREFNEAGDRILDERGRMIGEAMTSLFPGNRFAVWPKLVTSGWWRQADDPDFEGDMSIEAAFDRASALVAQEHAAGG